MPACVAIIAHAAAAATIADFQPRWQRINLPIIAFLPESDQWPGAPVDRVIHYGVNAHKGMPVYERFMHCCRTLLETDYEFFCIMEYDTVNLTDELPSINASALNFAGMQTWGVDVAPGQIIALSPWIASRPMLAALLEALKMQLKNPLYVEWVGGLLDRWIGTAVQAARLPYQHIKHSIPWCDDSWGEMLELIVKHQAVIVHGWKSKDKFKHLWPTP